MQGLRIAQVGPTPFRSLMLDYVLWFLSTFKNAGSLLCQDLRQTGKRLYAQREKYLSSHKVRISVALLPLIQNAIV